MPFAFSIPPYPDLFSTTPNPMPILFVPNIKYINRFIQGDLGISKKIWSAAIARVLAQCPDADIAQKAARAYGVTFPQPASSYMVNGKFIPPASFGIEERAYSGFLALEKTLITSIFETQKPYFEIAKLVIEHFVEIEDIIANILCIIMRSKKPAGNPRALGYQGTQEGGGVSSGLDKLDQYAKKKGPKNKLSENKFDTDNLKTPDQKTSDNVPDGFTTIIESVDYSTGTFQEGVNYNYIYKDIYEDTFNLKPGTASTAIPEDDDDLDTSIILGVYDSDWNLITLDEINERIPWVKKRYINNGPWPQLKEGQDYDFIYTARRGLVDVESVGLPTDPAQFSYTDPITLQSTPVEWKVKVYKEDGPSIDTPDGKEYIKKGFPVIAYNNNKINSTFEYYKTYYLEYTVQKINESLGTQSSMIEDDNGQEVELRDYSRNKISGMLSDFSDQGMLSTEIEGLVDNNFLRLSLNNTDNLANKDKFKNIANCLKPHKIQGVWYNPESDYDMKILKCDSTTDITFEQTVGEPELKGKILRFIKKTFSIEFANQKTLSYNVMIGNRSGFNNQRSLTIDYFTDQGVEKFTILETNQTFDLSNPDSVFPVAGDFPIVFENKELPNSFLQFNTAYQATSGNFQTRMKFELLANSYALKVENKYLQTSGWSASTSYDLNSAPFNAKNWLGSTEFAQIDFGNPRVAVIIERSTKKFVSLKVNTDFNQFIPSNNQIVNVVYNIETNQTAVTTDTKTNLIRIDDLSSGTAKKRVISKVNVTNEQLEKAEVFGKSPYGTPIISTEPGADPGEQARQSVEQFYRYQRTFDDTKTYFIVEGILKSKNKNKLKTPNELSPTQENGTPGDAGGGNGYYRKWDILLVIKKFIKLLIKVFAKLFPAIQRFITLIKNPAQFITDTIIAKMGDDFGNDAPKFRFFCKDFMEAAIELRQYIDNLKRLRNAPEIMREDALDEVKAFIKTSVLKNYIDVLPNGDAVFVLDGRAVIKLFGDAPILRKLPWIIFGIESNISSIFTGAKKPIFRLIFEMGGFGSKTNLSLDQINPDTLQGLTNQIKDSALFNTNFDPRLAVTNEIITRVGANQFIQEVSVLYSTGIFRDDVQYTYTEVTQEVADLVARASQLRNIGDRESLEEAKDLLEKALELDPNNKAIVDQLNEMKKINKMNFSQIIFDFLLNLVSLPLKVIIGIIMYILDFFKSLANPFSLPVKIVEFLSFKWLIDFFNPMSPNSMFAMAGILFDIPKFLTEWVPAVKMGTKLEFDLNEIIRLPWTKFPIFTLQQFKDLIYGFDFDLAMAKMKDYIPNFEYGKLRLKIPFLPIISFILCLIEAIINCFMDLIWSIFGMVDPESGRWIIIPPPYLKFCRNTSDQLSVKDMIDLMNGKFTPPRPSTEGAVSGTASGGVQSETPSYNFVYDIKTSDGLSVKDLNDQQLDQWLEDNKDIEFSLDF